MLGMLLEKLCGLHALLQSAPELLGPFEVGRDLAIGVCVCGCVLCACPVRGGTPRDRCVCVRVCVCACVCVPFADINNNIYIYIYIYSLHRLDLCSLVRDVRALAAASAARRGRLGAARRGRALDQEAARRADWRAARLLRGRRLRPGESRLRRRLRGGTVSSVLCVRLAVSSFVLFVLSRVRSRRPRVRGSRPLRLDSRTGSTSRAQTGRGRRARSRCG